MLLFQNLSMKKQKCMRVVIHSTNGVHILVHTLIKVSLSVGIYYWLSHIISDPHINVSQLTILLEHLTTLYILFGPWFDTCTYSTCYRISRYLKTRINHIIQVLVYHHVPVVLYSTEIFSFFLF